MKKKLENLNTIFSFINIVLRMVRYKKLYRENQNRFVTIDECQLYFNQRESNLWPNFGVGSKFGRRVVYPQFLEASVR